MTAAQHAQPSPHPDTPLHAGLMATIPVRPLPRPIPPLSSYDGVSVFARTWGFVRFHRASFPAMYGSPEKNGWKRAHHDLSNVWKHPELPGHVVARDFKRYGWVVVQRFAASPDVSTLDRIAKELVGGRPPMNEVALPLRLRLPVHGGYAPMSPGAARCRQVRDTPAFTLEAGGIACHISLVESTERQPRKLWVQALLGSVFTTAEGTPRRALFAPDLRHLSSLHQSWVLDTVVQVVDSMIAVRKGS